jgi:signal transduction histidine kinase
MSKDILRDLPLFSGLADEDLDRLLAMAEPVTVRAGDVLIEEGTPADGLYIALEGRFDISMRSDGRDTVLEACGRGDVIGEIALLEQANRTATVTARSDGRLLKVGKDTFESLLGHSPRAAMAVLRTAMARLRNTELMLRHSAKMASLGTLSAGLAHELNNPAAAVKRSAVQLRPAMAELQGLAAQLAAFGLDATQAAVIAELRRELPKRAAVPTAADSLARSDQEADLQSWLEAQGVEKPWEAAPAIASLGWDVASLGSLAEVFAPSQRPTFASWLAAACTVYTLMDEVSQGAQRISEIVTAVKSYSHLDRAPVQMVDVHEGLENTLVILRHKLKGGVKIVRDYGANLPHIEAYAGDLNQVWTNLIDNAVDAIQGQGEIRVRTRADDRYLTVTITDSGPGIPPAVQPRIFDAFYTTKEPGSGTGLGLHITYNIVVHQHKGEIKVDSRPGETTFTVRLPLIASGQQPAGTVQ